jgi:hypothetical protein
MKSEASFLAKKKKKPVGNVVEEIVSDEVLEIDISQLPGTAIDGIAAHLLEVSEVIEVVHFDGAPHEWILAEIVPQLAHMLRARQDLDGA